MNSLPRWLISMTLQPAPWLDKHRPNVQGGPDRTDRHREALELISRALAEQPDNAAIIDSHGWVLYRLGKPEEALSELRRAFTKQKDAEIAAHVAEVLWRLGQKDEAMKYFEESRRIEPDNRSLDRKSVV